ncbi:uncharacterized protein LOC126842302 isoform X1 [Adelges cooleyi]|uniref:uncharacterized protein LOC126842302 isoform X1 n=1 Tax=Adelges cooleyi TaxID=133065 RepID=UPI00217F6421|nr:uncharacterized protein LOC126842302 isoform X1 [Adelges cooleyi]
MHAKAIFVLCLIICCLKLTYSGPPEERQTELYNLYMSSNVEEIDQPMNYEKQPDTDASEGANVKKEDDVAQDKPVPAQNEQPNAQEKKRKSNCLSKLLCGRHKE